MKGLKRILPDIAAIVLFALISFAYFCPAVFEGRILAQHDAVAGIGSGREMQEYLEHTGERTRWTNAIFGGMPTYQMAPSYDSTDTLNVVQKLYHLYLPTYVWYVFVMLLGFYILLRAFDFKVWMSALGAIVWAFSSYFFIIIAAGHIWKFVTLAYIPPTIAGMVLVYRGKYLAGGIVTALFAALQIVSNHLQMTYYFLFVMLFMAVAYGVIAWKEKRFASFVKGTGILALAGVLAVCVNLSNLYHTYQYSKESMRGKSELVKEQSSNQTGSGLERDYITQWSYGLGETWTLLVPNVKGGASGLLSDDPIVQKHDMYGPYMRMLQNLYPQLQSATPGISHYWGEQPGTSGPVYAGAFVCLLFILGIFIVHGPIKWALVGGTVLSLLFAWGHNMMPVTDFFIDHLPLYNKFRTVASALVIAEFTLPLLAMLALAEIIRKPEQLTAKPWKFITSFILTGGASLLFALFPGILGNCITTNEQAILIQLQPFLPGPELTAFTQSITAIRQAIVSADAWRSFGIILTASVFLLLYLRGKLKAISLIVILFVICLADMWQVNKRYLNDKCYVEAWQNERTFDKTPADEEILKDPSPDYRVLNLSTNTFNENNTSYWHKSIGGYHAAKLRRYQDLIDHCLTKEMTRLQQAIQSTDGNLSQVNGDTICPVLNMLNMKYVIVPTQQGTASVYNPWAAGNAWFARELRYVEGARAEMAGLQSVIPTRTAIVDKSFSSLLKQAQGLLPADSTATVTLTDYSPNALTYKVNSRLGGIIVCSEIYYPGWRATLDGKPIDIARANYVLRAVHVPSGEHTLAFSFHPASIAQTEIIAYVALFILLAGFLWALFKAIKKLKA